MKKILGALVLGVMTAGLATADISIGINYRNGVDVFKYVGYGKDARTTDDYGNTYDDSGYDNNGSTYSLFNLNGWNAGKDDVTLKASGDIFSFQATLQPTIASDAIVFGILRIGAEFLDGNLFLASGWNVNGVMNYRVPRDGNNGNEEGKYWESFKLGSAFSGDASCVNNQIGFNTGKDFYLQAGYSFVFSKKANMKVTGTIISDRTWDAPTNENRGGNLGWSVFVQPKIVKVFDAEIFAKGTKDAADKQTLIFGAYGKPLVTPLIADAGIGGSVRLYDGELAEWNVDVRLLFEISENLTITSMNKFSKIVKNTDGTDSLADGGAISAAVGGLKQFKSSQILWNFLGARYKLNKTVTAIGALGQITDLDSGYIGTRDSSDGTNVFVFPHVQIYANPKISFYTGVAVGIGGIGAAEEANKDIDVVADIPLFFRVKM